MRSRALVATAALVRDTFREAFARKVFWGFFGCSTAVILFFIFIMKIDVVQGAMATISLFGREGRAREVEKLVREAHGGIAAFLYTAGVFLSVFASAGLIPTIFEPGRIELLLSKPVARYHILLGRYIGSVLIIAFNMFYLVTAVWIIFGFKTGVWAHQFLYSTAISVFVFAVLLSVVLVVAVLTESSVVAMMVAFGLMFISPITAQRQVIAKLLDSEWSRNLVRGLYHLLPKVFDLGAVSRQVVLGHPVTDWMPFWSSALFAAAMLSLGLWAFSRRNY